MHSSKPKISLIQYQQCSCIGRIQNLKYPGNKVGLLRGYDSKVRSHDRGVKKTTLNNTAVINDGEMSACTFGIQRMKILNSGILMATSLVIASRFDISRLTETKSNVIKDSELCNISLRYF